MVLVSRDTAGAEETAQQVMESWMALGRDGEELEVVVLGAMDFNCRGKELADICERVAASCSKTGEACVRATIVHNAGSLRIASGLGIEEGVALEGVGDALAKQLDVNVTSMIVLTSAIMRHLRAREAMPAVVHIVNVSSLLAVVPQRALLEYCVAKAARDMALRVLATEFPVDDSSDFTLKTLNYAPGPMDTGMQETLRADSPDAKMWQDMKEEGKLVPVLTSATKMAGILRTNEFESGAHIDFFDE